MNSSSLAQPLLTPPEPIQQLSDQQAAAATPLPADMASRVDDQVERFMTALLSEDIHNDSFKAKLDSAFHLGREEIAATSSLLNGRFMALNQIGMEESPAFKAIQNMRKHLDDLNPGKAGDLLSQHKLLRVFPFGDKLKVYFRKFQSTGAQLQLALQQIYAARDDLQRDGVEIEATRAKLWDAMQKLKAAIRFAEQLDAHLSEKVISLKATDAERAKALEQEVLFYARQNLQDMLTQQAVCVHGYLSLDVLKKTCRETIVGCNRVATTGMSAFAVAQTVAHATGNQVKVMDMLTGVNVTVENLLAESGKQMNLHAERTAEFASNPLLGIEKLKEVFDVAFQAMDTMDAFRSKAIDVMAQNNTLLREQVQRAQAYLDKTRLDNARAVMVSHIAGPVKL